MTDYQTFLLAELHETSGTLIEAVEQHLDNDIIDTIIEIRALALLLAEVDILVIPNKHELVHKTVRTMDRTKHRWKETQR